MFDSYGADPGLFRANHISTMAADALAPYIARSSATIELVI